MPYAAILPITKADTMSETFIHPSSFVDDGAVIGPGCRIWHFSHIMAGAVLGPACNIGQNVMVAADVKLGRQVKVQNNVSIYSGVICEDYVFLGPSCVFTNVKNPRSEIPRRDQYKTTRVRQCHRRMRGRDRPVRLRGRGSGRYALGPRSCPR